MQDPVQLEAILKQYRHHTATAGERNAEVRQATEDGLKKVRRKINNMAATIEDTEDGKRSATLAKRLAQLEQDEADLQRQLTELPRDNGTSSTFNPDKIKNGLAQLSERLGKATSEEERQILAAFVHKVVVDRIENRLYGQIEIYLPYDDLKPPTPLAPRHPPKRKPRSGTSIITVPISRASLGAPRYTHSIEFEFKVASRENQPKSHSF